MQRLPLGLQLILQPAGVALGSFELPGHRPGGGFRLPQFPGKAGHLAGSRLPLGFGLADLPFEIPEALDAGEGLIDPLRLGLGGAGHALDAAPEVGFHAGDAGAQIVIVGADNEFQRRLGAGHGSGFLFVQGGFEIQGIQECVPGIVPDAMVPQADQGKDGALEPSDGLDVITASSRLPASSRRRHAAKKWGFSRFTSLMTASTSPGSISSSRSRLRSVKVRTSWRVTSSNRTLPIQSGSSLGSRGTSARANSS
ncbi:hypothetical protein MAIT1_04584 [Magnetofaba australis IT-1]|uniref:Uncharacterized protein n=1 Tax=Magnetofaba australis IT-1 TaxID=1434232 RepID=A0A1Y2KBZ9_9PROT|nr:hypothetical protein MAIT1_04584 [Magnetofaba australis IT-1]